MLHLLKVSIGGPVFGYVMARLTLLWLSRIFNDALVEITITLASTYITYYIGEIYLLIIILGSLQYSACVKPQKELKCVDSFCSSIVPHNHSLHRETWCQFHLDIQINAFENVQTSFESYYKSRAQDHEAVLDRQCTMLPYHLDSPWSRCK